jgi:murein DD-endopeptidase MepM/ murein hydrolase activator NlpD
LRLQLKKGQYLWPVMGLRITSRVGSRWGKLHGGIDVAAARGSIVVGATEGTVMIVGDQGAYGHCVFVENHDGTVAWYAHLTESYVKTGDKNRARADRGHLRQYRPFNRPTPAL